MDFEAANFRGASSSISPALIAKNDEELEKRRLKLHEEAIKLEQIHYNLLEQHDRKLLERLNADLADYSVFIPLYPELPPLQFALNWRSPVDEITSHADQTSQMGHVTNKRQRENDETELPPLQFSPIWRSPVEEITCRVDQAGQTGQGNKKRQREKDEMETCLDKKQKVDLPESELKSKPIKDLNFQNSEPVKYSYFQNSEPVQDSNFPNSEPFKDSNFKNSEPIKDPITLNPEPVKESNFKNYEPIKDPITQESEPDKNLVSESDKKLINEKYEPVNKQKLDLTESPLIMIKLGPNEEKISETRTQGTKGDTGTSTGTDIINEHNKASQISGNKCNKKKILKIQIPKKEWFCDLCKLKILFQNPSFLEQHFNSNRHLANLIKQKSQPEPVKQEPKPVKEKKKLSAQITKKEWFCDLCKLKIVFQNPSFLEQHFKSNKHIANLAKINQNSQPEPEPDKNLVTNKSKPVKKSESVKEKPEPVKTLITMKSEHIEETETHLNKKQKLDLSISPLMIKIKSEPSNEENTTILHSSHKDSQINPNNQYDKKKTVPAMDPIRQETKPVKVQKGEFFCQLCNIKTPTENALKDHIHGHKHKSNLKEFLTKPVMDPIRQESKSVKGKNTVCFDIRHLYCNVCKIKEVSKKGLKDHFRGLKHKANLDSLLNGSLTGTDSLLTKISNGWFCNLCNVSCGPIKALNEHLGGRKHQNNIRSGSGPVKDNMIRNPAKRFGNNRRKNIEYREYGYEPVKTCNNMIRSPVKELVFDGSGSGPVKACNNMIRNPVRGHEFACVLCEFRACNDNDLAQHFWTSHQDDVIKF